MRKLLIGLLLAAMVSPLAAQDYTAVLQEIESNTVTRRTIPLGTGEARTFALGMIAVVVDHLTSPSPGAVSWSFRPSGHHFRADKIPGSFPRR